MLHDPKALVDSIIEHGKAALDTLAEDIGRQVIEGIMLIEREEIPGSRYHSKDSSIKKWSNQQGSVFLGKSRKKVIFPRLRGPHGEILLKSYRALRKPDVFSDQLLTHMLTGMSGRRHSWLVEDALERLGVSSSSVSRHVVHVTMSVELF